MQRMLIVFSRFAATLCWTGMPRSLLVSTPCAATALLQAMDHVKGVQVDLDTKLATVEVEAPNLIDAMNMLPEFVKTIKASGLLA